MKNKSRLMLPILAIIAGVAASAFTATPKHRANEYVYFNTSNSGSINNPPTAAQLSSLHYTGEDPSTVCNTGNVRCSAVYTAPSQPAIGASPVSTSDFVSIDSPTGHYK
ncbi:MAG: hypothetical protein EPN37_16355 [Chitinophagaceae bacterium]|nr:MAG: hypothetical protein EPN37_16355 [Chitinophagaceae bacterium]